VGAILFLRDLDRIDAPVKEGTMTTRMIVDVQNHVLPASLAVDPVQAGLIDLSTQPPAIRWRGIAFGNTPDMLDVELHMQVCKDAGLTHIMLSQGMLLTIANEVFGMTYLDAAKRQNDEYAKIGEKYPGFVFPYGTVRPHDGKEAVREAERCVDELGFKAMHVDTSYGVTDRAFLHTPETFEFWEFASDRGIPVYIHPAMLCYGWEWMDRYKLEETVARPNETALCVSLMILSGLFDRFSGLRIILAHMGGSLLMVLPRLQFGYWLGYNAFKEYQKPKNLKEPVEYIKENIWVDTMGFDAPGMKHALEVFGEGHVLFGTDYGPVPINPKRHVDIICNDLGLSEEGQDKVLGLNAMELFGLPDPV
jgi:predicted TIM-barrel fold metal-dependent hydrolase